ncbi:MAG: hypothetical protein M1834_001185 [Cirrosporium novae-zelandiae]|nr:MAG: hypothetical protein M1834_001185 [Cirrosporium novae-zelandiae]
MMDSLGTIGLEKVPQLRYLQTRGNLFSTYLGNYGYGLPGTTTALAVSSSLQLNRFTVYDPFHYRFTDTSRIYNQLIYWEIENQIMQPSEIEIREPQPASWNRMIKERDGDGSGAFVKIYIGNTDEIGMTANPETREVFNQTGPQPGAVPEKLREREVLVVVRRGWDADYTEDDEAALQALQAFEDEYVPPTDLPR